MLCKWGKICGLKLNTTLTSFNKFSIRLKVDNCEHGGKKHENSNTLKDPARKITVVGAGNTGCACAAGLLNRKLVDELCLLGKGRSHAKGEALDFKQAAIFYNNARIYGGNDFSKSADSDIIILAAGEARKPGQKQTRLDLLQENVKIFGEIIPKLMKYNSNPILLIISNPVGILTHFSWRLSKLPVHRVIGTGTLIDTIRFQSRLADKLNISPSEIHGLVLGEHGEGGIPIWSSITMGGTKLKDVFPEIGKTDHWKKIYCDALDSGPKLIEMKGSTSWGIGAATVRIVEDILNNTGCVRPVSVEASKFLNKDNNVFLSLPCFIDRNGISKILKLQLDPDEQKALCEVADSHVTAMKSIEC